MVFHSWIGTFSLLAKRGLDPGMVKDGRSNMYLRLVIGKFSVVDLKLFFSDPDPTLTLISDSDPDPDPACL